MNFLGNLIWLIFGGFIVFVGYMVGGFMLCLTVVGIPFGVQCFKIGFATLTPFGLRITERGQENGNGPGCLSTALNILWIFCGGLWIALTHLVFGCLLCLTIVGIPFGRQHFKLMHLCLMPFGKRLS